MSRWNDAIRSIALEMLDGQDVSDRIARLARWFGMDVHSTTIQVEELASLLGEDTPATAAPAATVLQAA